MEDDANETPEATEVGRTATKPLYTSSGIAAGGFDGFTLSGFETDADEPKQLYYYSGDPEGTATPQQHSPAGGAFMLWTGEYRESLGFVPTEDAAPEPTQVVVATNDKGEGWTTINAVPGTVTIAQQPSKGTASIEPVPEHDNETCIKIVNGPDDGSVTVEVNIAA